MVLVWWCRWLSGWWWFAGDGVGDGGAGVMADDRLGSVYHAINMVSAMCDSHGGCGRSASTGCGSFGSIPKTRICEEWRLV